MMSHQVSVVLSLLIAGSVSEECDPKYLFENVQFKEVKLAKHEALTTDLVVSPSSGDIFFNELRTAKQNDFTVNILRNGTAACRKIEGFEGHPQGITIDEANDQVYFGSTKGLYKYNNVSGKAEIFMEPSKDITSVYYSNKILYFVTYPGYKPFKLDLDDSKATPKAINVDYADGIVIDAEGNIFYANEENHVYKHLHDTSAIVPIQGLPEKLVTALGVDRVGIVFLAFGNEIYSIKKGSTDAHHLIDTEESVTSFYFDKDDIMYAVIGDWISKFVVDESCI